MTNMDRDITKDCLLNARAPRSIQFPSRTWKEWARKWCDHHNKQQIKNGGKDFWSLYLIDNNRGRIIRVSRYAKTF